MMTSPSLLEIQALSVMRGGRLLFEALNAALPAGEALILTGVNGVGKSSLLRLLAGFMMPFSGDVCFAGNRLSEDPEQFQSYLFYSGHLDALKFNLTVVEQLQFWAVYYDAKTDRIAFALEALNLGALAALPARMLSAGQRRRLGLARLVLTSRPLWLLDEPSVSLDSESVTLLTQMMRAHLSQGGLIVTATHLPLELPGQVLRLQPVSNRNAQDEFWG